MTFFNNRQNPQAFADAVKGTSIHLPIQNIHEVAKRLFALLFIKKKLCTIVGLQRLFQRQGHVAPWTPITDVKEVQFGLVQ